ncbi:MAG: outer membrane protein assembly complex, YaeT protein [Fibrobacteria bacterium]|nr:outer membrane protein assembly complex, YaeT protein [Fibrobacteria bacterium]
MQSFYSLLRLCLLIGFGAMALSAQAQSGLLQSPSRQIRVADIRIEGNNLVDSAIILNTLQVEKGESYAPAVLRNRIQGSVTALNKLNLFSDIRVDEDSPLALDGVVLYFVVSELNVLTKVKYKGLKKLDEDDFRGKIDLIEGQVYSHGMVESSRQKILAVYREKGFLLATAVAEADTNRKTGEHQVTFVVDEGKKVVVRYVTFDGNAHVADKKLRKRFPIKEDRWWRSGDFKEDEYRLGLDTLLMYYQELGYLDAAVIWDSVRYSEDKRHIDVRVAIQEGRRYYFQRANFVHNNIVRDEALHAQILFDSGEVFNKQKYGLMKYQVSSLYREEGYLFVELNDRLEFHDSLVEVTFNIRENSLAHINLVEIIGNTKTKDKVIRREIKLFPGDVYRQSLLMRSQRDIMQLAFFDNAEPDIERVMEGDGSDVNLIFRIQEKESGTGTFSAGAAYSGRDGLVGTLGLQLPNCCMGDGQRVDASVEVGPYKRLYSLGFTEPWFMDTPTLVGATVFYSDQKSQYAQYNDYFRAGMRLTLGRRLTWPDDYFTVRSSYNYTFNDNGQARNPDYLIVATGIESSVNLTLVRDDKNLPFFPSDGSRYSLSYSRVGGPFGGNFDYSQWDSRVNWWFPVIQKLTLGVESQFGIILGENVQSYALYQMGGLLGYQGKLRGYYPGTVGGGRIARSFLSFTTELTYPVVENTFYVLAFFDAGNAFGRMKKYSSDGSSTYNPIAKDAAPSAVSEIDLSDLRRDVGFGFRVVVPMVAPFGMGFDFGWPLDDAENYDGDRIKNSSRSPKVQFTIEQGF